MLTDVREGNGCRLGCCIYCCRRQGPGLLILSAHWHAIKNESNFEIHQRYDAGTGRCNTYQSQYLTV